MVTSSQVRGERVGSAKQALLITLDRPHCANSYTAAMLDDLSKLLGETRAHGAVRAVVITGAGNAFCGGADLTELGSRSGVEALELRSREVFDRFADAPWLTLAALNGPAVGGGFELALACDLRVCTHQTFFKFPEVELGLVPAAGGIRRLVAEVGASRAKELVLFGKTLDAAAALAWGLVSRVDEQPLERTLELVEALATRDPMCIAAAKLLVADRVEALSGRGGEALAQALLYGRRQKARAT